MKTYSISAARARAGDTYISAKPYLYTLLIVMVLLSVWISICSA